MELSDLNNLELKDIAEAPMPVKAGLMAVLFVALVAAGWFFHLSESVDQLDAAKATEETLKAEYKSKKRKASNLDAYKQRLADTEKGLQALLRQLPSKAQMEALLTDVNQAGISRGLDFDLFRPGGESSSQTYATLPVSINVKGTYNELGYFISDVAKLPRIVTIHNITLTPRGNSEMTMDATVQTYRYLNDAEEAKK